MSAEYLNTKRRWWSSCVGGYFIKALQDQIVFKPAFVHHTSLNWRCSSTYVRYAFAKLVNP